MFGVKALGLQTSGWATACADLVSRLWQRDLGKLGILVFGLV